MQVSTSFMNSDVAKMIKIIRDKQVLLDRDIAALYGVETRRINEQVKRNIERFPEEFCFQLTPLEIPECLKSQIATLNNSGNQRGLHVKKMPYVFTEQGVAMLSSVLHSPSAVRVSIEIMKAFVEMRHYLLENGGLVKRLSNMEKVVLNQETKILDHDRKLDAVFEAMDRGEIKAKGLFYNNQEFDAYVFVCNLIRKANEKIVLVDNYVNESVLTMMLKRKEGVSVTIYTKTDSPIFKLDMQKFNAQYKEYPLSVLPVNGVHDRFLFVDNFAYHFGASLKDLGKKTFFFTRENFTLEEVLKKH